MCFNQIPKYYFLLDLVLSTSSSSTICHQRAFSLPQNSNVLNVINNQNAQTQSSVGNTSNTNGTNAIQPVHQRTRSLPLTEETAIDFSQSPPIFAKFSPSSFGSGVVENSTNPKINNNSMESIIEDYHNVDMSNNNGSRLNNGSNSILKQLSKIANSNLVSHNSASSPSQLRKKRQHHNVMTASLRSTYQYHPHKTKKKQTNPKKENILLITERTQRKVKTFKSIISAFEHLGIRPFYHQLVVDKSKWHLK